MDKNKEMHGQEIYQHIYMNSNRGARRTGESSKCTNY